MMKRSSASITLVLIGSAVALVGCEQRPGGYAGGSKTGDPSEQTTDTQGRRGGFAVLPFLMGRGAGTGAARQDSMGFRNTDAGTRGAAVGGTTRGGFGGSSRGVFGS